MPLLHPALRLRLITLAGVGAASALTLFASCASPVSKSTSTASVTPDTEANADADAETPLAALTAADREPADASSAVNGKWSPRVELRDYTNSFGGTAHASQPTDGWRVTPIHVNLLTNGQVLVTGWSRTGQEYCEEHSATGRQNGTTFLLNPTQLEAGQKILRVHPINEAPKSLGSGNRSPDVLYCSGHVPLADGRILFTGGAKYDNLDLNGQDEFGLNYARIYTPAQGGAPGHFKVVSETSPAGPAAKSEWAKWYEQGMMWYPTNTRLPDGRILVVGGWAKWMDVLAANKFDYLNKSVAVFDPRKMGSGQQPWSVLVSHEHAPKDLGIDTFDYPHVFLLPKPLKIAGRLRQVAIFGGGMTSRIQFLDIAGTGEDAGRLASLPKAVRKGGGSNTSALMLDTGEIMIIGGGNAGREEGQRIDIYDPAAELAGKEPWRSIDTGITRVRPSSVLLPDGQVLLVNGEGMWNNDHIGNRRQPMIFDPHGAQVDVQAATRAPWTGDAKERGYHAIALLLKDGRVLIGGGRTLDRNEKNVEEFRIGCERNDIRIYTPPYLAKGLPRPRLVGLVEGQPIKIGGAPFKVGKIEGAKLRAKNGVALMALGAQTHAFDQNQRYVPLKYTVNGQGEVSIAPPANASIAPGGKYNLFFISEQGVPSKGITVSVNL